MAVKLMCLIPARGGSKRIPRKNLRPFLGVPCLERAIKTAWDSDLFHDVFVSSEDTEILAKAGEWGAEPIVRPAKLADDAAGLEEVIDHAFTVHARSGFDAACVLLPTAVLTTPQLLQSTFNEWRGLREYGLSPLVPVVSFDRTPWRALKMNENGHISFILPEYQWKNTQDCKPAFYDAGMFYWLNVALFTAEWKHRKPLLGQDCVGYVMSPDAAQDVDTEWDWTQAEEKYGRLHGDT